MISLSLASIGTTPRWKSKRNFHLHRKPVFSNHAPSNLKSQKCPRRWWEQSIRREWSKTYRCQTQATLRTVMSSTRRGRSRGCRSSRVKWWRNVVSLQLSTQGKQNHQCRHSRFEGKNLVQPSKRFPQLWIMRACQTQIRLPTSQ